MVKAPSSSQRQHDTLQVRHLMQVRNLPQVPSAPLRLLLPIVRL
jgi:hypothetical protein